MIQQWHHGRQGVALKFSRVCQIACTLDLVCGQSLCLSGDPMYEASFGFSSALANDSNMAL
jgi:hypothetical protein